MVQFRLMRGEWKSGKENIAISASCNGRSEYLDEQSAATINLQKVSPLITQLLILAEQEFCRFLWDLVSTASVEK
jgi:hypothetical protein